MPPYPAWGPGKGKGASAYVPSITPAPPGYSGVPCLKFQQGWCSYGNSCKFDHVAAPAAHYGMAAPPAYESFAAWQGAQPQMACAMWRGLGYCPRGPQCAFAASHTEETRGKGSVGLPPAQPKP